MTKRHFSDYLYLAEVDAVNPYEIFSNKEMACDWSMLAYILQPIIGELTDVNVYTLPVQFEPQHKLIAGHMTPTSISIGLPLDEDEDDWPASHIITIFHEIGHYVWNPRAGHVGFRPDEITDVLLDLDDLPRERYALIKQRGRKHIRILNRVHHASQAIAEAQAIAFAILAARKLSEMYPNDGNMLDIVDASWSDVVSINGKSPLLTLWLAEHNADIDALSAFVRDPTQLAQALLESSADSWDDATQCVLEIIEDRWQIDPGTGRNPWSDVESQDRLLKRHRISLKRVLQMNEDIWRNACAELSGIIA